MYMFSSRLYRIDLIISVCMNSDCVCAYMTDLECSDDCAFTCMNILYRHSNYSCQSIDCTVEPFYCGHPWI